VRMDHGMILEAGVGTLADGRAAIPTRLESIGWKIPERILTTRELMESTRHHSHIELERLTGIHQRHVCSEGEDSYTLAIGAARDCLAHSRHGPEDIEMLINCSISRYKGGLRHQWESPLSLSVRRQNISDKRARLLRDGLRFWPRPRWRPDTPFCDVAS
jgi:3-oxoacyl-[acyl-carrier-protein] synthase-3